MKKVFIYGAGDLGKVIKNLLRYTDFEFSGFISDVSEGPEIIGDFEFVAGKFDNDIYGIVLAVGYTDLENRFRIYKNIKNLGYNLPVIIHPSANICDTVLIKEGTIIMSGSNVDFNSEIGEIVVIWPNSVVSHDSVIGPNSFLSPNSTICGFCNIGCNSFIGAGAVIVDHTEVPDNSFIKAASLYKNKKI